MAGKLGQGGLIGRVDPALQRLQGQRPIEHAGVEKGRAETIGQHLSDRRFTGAGGAIYRDDEPHALTPSCFSSPLVSSR